MERSNNQDGTDDGDSILNERCREILSEAACKPRAHVRTAQGAQHCSRRTKDSADDSGSTMNSNRFTRQAAHENTRSELYWDLPAWCLRELISNQLSNFKNTE
jgi:hypothetical protein